jgi:hypothetical protein
MLMLKRILLFISSFTIIGIAIQFFMVILTEVNQELFLIAPGLQPHNFVY